MVVFLTLMIIAVSVLLMLIVLIQNPKGGGLGAGFGGGGSGSLGGGVQQTNSFLDKATWTLVVVLFVLCILSSAFIDRGAATTPTGETPRSVNIDYDGE